MKKNFKTFIIGFILIVGAMALVGCGEKKIESNPVKVPTTSIIETTTTEPIEPTEAPTEMVEITEPIAVLTVETLEDVFVVLEKDLTITIREQQFAELIGAKDGYSFDANGLTFELYIYEDGAAELEDAADGSLSYELYEGYEVELNTYVNKNFVLVYYEEDTAVIDAFMVF